jgi:hypothetical protein
MTFVSFVKEHRRTIDVLLKEGSFNALEVAVLKAHGVKGEVSDDARGG